MAAEILWVIYIVIVGALLLALAAPGLPAVFRTIYTFPAGMCIVTVAMGTASLLSRDITGETGLVALAACLLLTLTGLGLLTARSWDDFLLRVSKTALLGGIPSLAGVLLTVLIDPSFIVGDTVIQGTVVQRVVAGGWDGAGVPGSLASWSFQFLFGQLLAVASGGVYFTVLGSIVTATTVFCFCQALFECLRGVFDGQSRADRTLALGGAVALTAGVFGSCFYFPLILSFVTSNALLVGYGCLFALAMFACRDRVLGERDAAILLSISMIGIGLSRVEGVIYASFFGAWLVAAQVMERTTIRLVFSVAVLPLTIVNGILLVYSAPFDAGAAILSPIQFAAIIVIFMLWLPFSWIGLRFLPKDLMTSALYAAALVTSLATCVLLFLKPELMTSLGALLVDMFKDRIWGPIPFLLAAGLAVLVWQGRDRVTSSGLAMVVLLFCLVLLLALGRTPYYVDINDSGHRLMGSIALPALMIVLIGCIELVGRVARSRPETAPP